MTKYGIKPTPVERRGGLNDVAAGLEYMKVSGEIPRAIERTWDADGQAGKVSAKKLVYNIGA